MTVKDDDVDSLESALAEEVDPRRRVDLLNDLAWELRTSDVPRGITLSQQAVAAAGNSVFGECGYPEGRARGLSQLGRLFLRLSRHDRARDALVGALELYESLDDPLGRADQLQYLGTVCAYSGDYAEALHYKLSAQAFFRQLENHHRQAKSLNDIGFIYVDMGEPEKGLPYLQESLALAREIDYRVALAVVLDSLATVYLKLEEYERALRYGREGLTIAREEKLQHREAELLITLGRIYHAQERLDLALEMFEQGLALGQSMGYLRLVGQALHRMGRLYLTLERPQQAVDVLQQALDLMEDLSAKPCVFECHQALACAHEQLGEYRRALVHYKKFLDIKEVVFNEHTDQRLKMLEVEYQVEAARREAELTQQKNEQLQQEIAERKRVEENLRITNRRLQDEIQAHERLIKDLNAFTHTVAHDLKTPLSIVEGYADLVLLDLETLDVPDTALYVLNIRETVETMTRIINELLMLANVRQRDVQLSSIQMEDIVARVKTRLAETIKASDAVLVEPDAWPTALGYAPWIEEVWVNYLCNGVKYGGEPPHIELGAEHQDDTIRFWVRDNGIGIPPEKQSQLFTPFNRLGVRIKDGHGLGLALVKRILDKLGGEVGVESSGVPGEGSTFYFVLPAGDTA
jgi:signal transduction histidine kinase/uncharacterized protein HemY